MRTHLTRMVLLWLLAAPGLAQAQVIRGRLIDDETDRGIDGGIMSLMLGERVVDRILSDSTGAFALFAPAVGVIEDPATGSAAGALGGYLARILKFPTELKLNIEQGKEIGRKSLLHTHVRCDRGLVQSVKVSGQVVSVGEGSVVV